MPFWGGQMVLPRLLGVVVLGLVSVRPATAIIESCVETVSAACREGGNQSQSSMRVSDGTLQLTEVLLTPNPCFKVQGDVTLKDRDILVTLEIARTGGICAQCLGEIIGRVTVNGLPEGVYTLHIRTPEGSRSIRLRVPGQR